MNLAVFRGIDSMNLADFIEYAWNLDKTRIKELEKLLSEERTKIDHLTKILAARY